MELERVLRVKDVIFFNIIAMVGLRWMAWSSSGAGWSSISLWILAILTFFIPQALVVSELSRIKPVEGGLYIWAKDSLGDFHGFIDGWCYWTNNFIYYPALLGFVVPTIAFMAGRGDLATNRWFVLSMILLFLWIAVIVNMFGLRPTKRMENLGGMTTIGVWIIILILAGMCVAGSGIQNPLEAKDLLPQNIGLIGTWSILCFALAGFELISALGGEIKDPKKTIYKGVAISAIGIGAIYLMGTIAILSAIPIGEIRTDIGIQESIETLAGGMVWLAEIAFVLILIGGVAGVGAWLAGTSRISYEVGLNKRLPKFFSSIHPKWKTPYWSILFQGIVASILAIVAYGFAKVPEAPVGELIWKKAPTTIAYEILVEMTAIIYLIPFVYLFLSFLKIKLKDKSLGRGYIPGGRIGIWAFGGLGLGSSLLAVILPFIGLIGASMREAAILVGGTASFLVAGVIVYILSEKYIKREEKAKRT
jgi:amino acid transporter